MHLDGNRKGSSFTNSKSYESPSGFEANSFLAGSKNFKIDNIEVFSVKFDSHKLNPIPEGFKSGKFQQVRRFSSAGRRTGFSGFRRKPLERGSRSQKRTFRGQPQRPNFDPSIDYYKALGVSEKSNQADVKKQYYKMAKKYHPDNGSEGDAE